MGVGVGVDVFFQPPAHFGCVVLLCMVCIFSVSKVRKIATYSLFVWSYKASSGQPGVAMYSSVE